jgi:bifunctional non-homologous end joining protein LigD
VLPRIQPMRLKSVSKPFKDDSYIFELKHDGFRAVAYFENAQCKLFSRNQNALAFKSLRDNLAKLPVKSAIIDGEIIALDSNGRSVFHELLHGRNGKARAVLYAFDLLWLDGEDLRQRPLLERKERLEKLVRKSGLRLMYAQHVEGDGRDLFKEVCYMDLEGIVAKRKDSVYKNNGTGWLKMKNPKYSHAEGRHELLTGKK